MPTYQYRCSACSKEFEQYQKFTDPALTVCPSCDGAIRRVIQPVGVVFKGSGFYVNDSRKSENGSSNGAKKSEMSEPAEAVTEKSDSAEKVVKSEKTGTAAKSAPKETAATPKAKAGATAGTY